jgi:hypothetical protein
MAAAKLRGDQFAECRGALPLKLETRDEYELDYHGPCLAAGAGLLASAEDVAGGGGGGACGMGVGGVLSGRLEHLDLYPHRHLHPDFLSPAFRSDQHDTSAGSPLAAFRHQGGANDSGYGTDRDVAQGPVTPAGPSTTQRLPGISVRVRSF